MSNHQTLHQTTAVGIFLLSLLVNTKATTAQVIEQINIDPYNNSNVQTTPLDINTPPASKITDTVYIDAKPTPRRSTQIQGSLTSSSEFLPAIPPLNEPYSRPQTDLSISDHDTSIAPTNTSISVSPYDITPEGDDNIIKTNQIVKNKTKASTINITPVQNNQQSRTNKPVNSAVNNNNQNRLPLNRQQKSRRTLKDILVQSNSSSTTTENNSSTVIKIKTNNNTSVVSTSISNQQARKVLVKVSNEEEKLLIKSYYPEAFNKTINGDSFLQIGIFSSNENIDQVSQSLAQIGFKAIVIP